MHMGREGCVKIGCMHVCDCGCGLCDPYMPQQLEQFIMNGSMEGGEEGGTNNW